MKSDESHWEKEQRRALRASSTVCRETTAWLMLTCFPCQLPTSFSTTVLSSRCTEDHGHRRFHPNPTIILGQSLYTESGWRSASAKDVASTLMAPRGTGYMRLRDRSNPGGFAEAEVKPGEVSEVISKSDPDRKRHCATGKFLSRTVSGLGYANVLAHLGIFHLVP